MKNLRVNPKLYRNSLIFDIIKGMLHLHQTVIGSHGNLKPSNCLIDSRFMVKITDFGIIGQQSKVKRIPKNGFKGEFQRSLPCIGFTTIKNTK